MKEFQCIAADVTLGKNVKIARFVNLYGCSIGNNTKIGAFVEIQKNAVIGRNCKISSHTFICSGVRISDNCFIGHGVMFINDNYPKAVKADNSIENDRDWADRFVRTKIGQNVSIGTNATILGGISIGNYSIIGAGSVVTRCVPPGQVWAGNPARKIRAIKK